MCAALFKILSWIEYITISASDLNLQVCCDLDWGSCSMARQSVTGYSVQLRSTSIAWKGGKQDTISHSSAEVEYRAMADTTSKVVWIQSC